MPASYVFFLALPAALIAQSVPPALESPPARPPQVPQPLAEGNKVYTIGIDQIRRIFHDEAQYNFPIWKKVKNFRTLAPILPLPGRTTYG